MPIVPVTQPQPVTPGGGFDYVAVDARAVDESTPRTAAGAVC